MVAKLNKLDLHAAKEIHRTKQMQNKEDMKDYNLTPFPYNPKTSKTK